MNREFGEGLKLFLRVAVTVRVLYGKEREEEKEEPYTK
jgi:hypothetical protein